MSSSPFERTAPVATGVHEVPLSSVRRRPRRITRRLDASPVAAPAGGLCNKTLLALFDEIARKYGLDLAQLRVFADHLAKALDV